MTRKESAPSPEGRVRDGAALPREGSGAVASPCTNVCRMNEASGWCEGCWRTIDEIVAWAVLDEPERRAVWLQLEVRRRGTGDRSR
ncbi:MAG: DUF1289 domain-containing protein [Methylibium sp.]|nr:DUF1289 domain-containing protein [Methylibium sp.]MBA3588035.1 DUF1289 domain-containing protein [Methylibium sp.]